MSSILDNTLIEKYKTMINLDNLLYTNNSILYKSPLNINNNLFISTTSNIQNISVNSNLLVNNITNNINSITINSNLNVSSNTIFCNITSNSLNFSNLNISNNLTISNISILNNNTTILSSLLVSRPTTLNTVKTLNISPINNVLNINATNINIGNVGIDMSNVNFNGTISSIITNELNVVDKLVSFNANITNLTAIDIGNNAGLEILGTTSPGYIRTSNNSSYYELKYPNNNSIYLINILDSNNNLYITGSTLLYNNNTIKSSLNVSNNLLTQNLSINSSLNISYNTILNNSVSINNNLFISSLSLLNNNVSMYKNLNLNNNLYTNNLSMLSCNVSNNSLLNNTSLLSSFYVNNNNIITQNATVSSALNVSNISIFNNVSLNSSLNISNNTILLNNTTLLSSLYVSSNSKFINNSTILSNLNVSNNSIINGSLTLGSSLNIKSTIIANLPEYKDNITASNAGIPLWGLYRTGGIVKIRLDTSGPVITINGSNPTSIKLGYTYTELGATALDNLDGVVSVSSSGTVNTTLFGTYYIIYSATDSYYNTSTAIRTINVIALPSYYVDSSSYLKFNGTYNIFNQNTAWTIESWIYPTDLSNNNGQSCSIFSFSSNENVFIYVNAQNRLGWLMLNTDSNLSTPTININQWYHIAIMRSTNGIITIILNGTYYSTYNIGSTTTSNNLTPFYLGVFNPVNRPIIVKKFVGYISQTKISNTQRYNVASIPFTPPTDLTPLSSELSNTLFYLGNNYTDTISNTQATIVGNVTMNTTLSYP